MPSRSRAVSTELSVSVKSGTAAWPLRSSGTAQRPRCGARSWRSAADRPRRRCVIASGSRGGTSPRQRSSSAFWPLPATPAMPKISPARTAKLMSLERGAEVRRSWRMVSPLTTSLGAPNCRPSALTISLRPPPIIFSAIERERLRARVAGIDQLAAAQDRRRVAQRFDLMQLVRNVEDRAALRRELAQHANSCSTSCGVSTEVGSSMISSFGLSSSARTISMRCRSPTDSVDTMRCGSSFSPYSVHHLADPASSSRAGIFASMPSAMFSSTVMRLEQREMLEHHADAELARRLGVGHRHRLRRSRRSRRHRAA